MFLINELRQQLSEKKMIKKNTSYIEADRYRDEIIKLKQELNKRNKEYQNLKVDYIKLETDNKSNLRLIELIISEIDSNDSNINTNGNVSEIIDNNNINKSEMSKDINNEIKNEINNDINDDINK